MFPASNHSFHKEVYINHYAAWSTQQKTVGVLCFQRHCAKIQNDYLPFHKTETLCLQGPKKKQKKRVKQEPCLREVGFLCKFRILLSLAIMKSHYLHKRVSPVLDTILFQTQKTE